MTRQEAIDIILRNNDTLVEREYEDLQFRIEEAVYLKEHFIYTEDVHPKTLELLKKDGFKIYHRTPKRNDIEYPDIIIAWITDAIDENGNFKKLI